MPAADIEAEARRLAEGLVTRGAVASVIVPGTWFWRMAAGRVLRAHFAAEGLSSREASERIGELLDPLNDR